MVETARWAGALLCLVVATQPAGAEDDRKVRGDDPPEWVNAPPATAFVGLSQPLPSEASARADALMAARLQIVDALGVRVDHKVLRRIVTRGAPGTVRGQGIDRAASVAQALIGVRAREYHGEEWVRSRPDGRRQTYWKVWVLVPFSKEAHHHFVAGWFRGALAVATARLADADRTPNALRGRVATSCVAGLDALADVLQLTGLDPTLRSSGAEVRGRLWARLREVAGEASRVSRASSCTHVPAAHAGDLTVDVHLGGAGTRVGLPVSVAAHSLAGERRAVATAMANRAGKARVRLPADACAGGCRVEAWVGPSFLLPEERGVVAPRVWTVRSVPAIVRLTASEPMPAGKAGDEGVAPRLSAALQAAGVRVLRSDAAGLSGCETARLEVSSRVKRLPAGPLGRRLVAYQLTTRVRVVTVPGGAVLGTVAYPAAKEDGRGFGLSAEAAAQKAYSLERSPGAIARMTKELLAALAVPPRSEDAR